jgi:acetolactate synthase I/II/III large subunit
MNQLSGGEAAVLMLKAHGVQHVFGLCGDTSLPFYDALARLDRGMTHILTRDERHAAYMADCYARVSGRVGVCERPSGGGATYVVPGVVEANESSIPVLAITTDISVSSRGKFTLTELDQEALFRPLTRSSKVIDRAGELPAVFRAAFRAMTSGRPGAAQIGLPFDVQRDPVDEVEVHGDAKLGKFPARRIGPDPGEVEAAAAALASAKEPIFICRGGPVIAGAEAELAELAELLEEDGLSGPLLRGRLFPDRSRAGRRGLRPEGFPGRTSGPARAGLADGDRGGRPDAGRRHRAAPTGGQGTGQ